MGGGLRANLIKSSNSAFPDTEAADTTIGSPNGNRYHIHTFSRTYKECRFKTRIIGLGIDGVTVVRFKIVMV